MKNKKFAAVLAMAAAILMILSPLMSAASANTGENHALIPARGVFTGNITIEPNGTVNYSVSGQDQFTHSGNYYNLTNGDIRGTLIIERSNAIVNGYGNFVTYNNTLGISLIIQNASHVTVSNLSINGSSNGMSIVNSSYIQVDNVNVNSSGYSLDIGNNTQYIRLSNSSFSDNYGTTGSLSAVWVGYNQTSSSMVYASSDISFYNDNVSMFGGSSPSYEYFIEVYSTNVIFDHMNLNGSNDAGVYSVGIWVEGVNTTIENSVLNHLYYSVETLYASNTTIVGNTMLNSSYIYPEYSQNLTISDNTLYNVNLYLYGTDNVSVTWNNWIYSLSSGYGFIYGDYVYNNTYIANNMFRGTMYYYSAIYMYIEEGSFVAWIQNNSFNLTLVSGTYTYFEAIYAYYGTLVADNNTMNMNATGMTSSSSLSAIYPDYVYMAKIYGNNIHITDSAGDASGVNATYAYQDVTASRNYISINGTGNMAGIFGSEIAEGTSNAFSGNTIYLNTSSDAIGVGLESSSNFTVSENLINLTTGKPGYGIGIQSSSHNITVSQNVIEGFGAATKSIGMMVRYSSNLSAYNNAIEQIYGSLDFSNVNNLTLVGNSLNSSFVSLSLDQVNSALIYHNNFIDYFGPISIIGGSALVFNASYPVGGNFWSSYTGVDNYSGPGQNLSGSDGIGDTPFSLNSTLSDYYPLTKPWTHPAVVFRETGLAPGTSWSATFNGVRKASTSGSISFAILDAAYANYTYSIGNVNNYTGGVTGTYHYMGNGTTYNVNFQGIRYTFRIQETGLATGTSWNITFNGTTYSTTGSYFSFSQLNGTTDSYSISNTSLYYVNAAGGSYTIDGAGKTVDIVFTHYSYIQGNVTPINATVTVNGNPVHVSNGKFNLTVTSGTYDVKVTDNGYKTYYDNFTLSAGKTQNVNASLSINSVPPSSSNMGEIYAAIGVSVVVVIGGIAYFFYLRPRK